MRTYFEECRSRIVVALWFLIALLLAASTAVVAAPGTVPSSLPSMQTSTPPTCINLVVNGDFEQGWSNPDPWVLGGFTEISRQRPHSGYYGVWMGGYKNADDTLYQLVTIPADSLETVTLRYWWNMDSLDDDETPYDYLYVTLQTADGEPLAELEALNNTGVRDTWVQSTFDLSEYSGMSLRIHFHCTGNEQFITSFFLDDVELEVCGVSETPTPTPTSTIEPTHRHYLPLVWHTA